MDNHQDGNGLQLQEGTAFSVEPGIYLPSKFGVRIEEIIVITGTEAKRMNTSTHTLQVVEQSRVSDELNLSTKPTEQGGDSKNNLIAKR